MMWLCWIAQHDQHSIIWMLMGCFTYFWHTAKGRTMPSTYLRVGTMIIPYHLNCQLTSEVWLPRMLEALNYVVGMVQPFGLCQEITNIPFGATSTSCKVWCILWPCWIVIISTNQVVIMVLVKWQWPKLTNNDQKWQKISLLCKKKTNEWRGKIISPAYLWLPALLLFKNCLVVNIEIARGHF